MNKKIIKLIILAIIACSIFAFFMLGLQQYASLDYAKQQQHKLLEYYQQNSILVLVYFGSIYILVTALSLPAATILTLLAGALFGFTIGLVMASFASTIGATISFLIARFIARDYIQKKYSKQLSKINLGFKSESAFYLFALRLVPAFPFFMINIIMGLMPIKIWTFYWVSQLGMLAGTIVYVYAGTQLAQIKSFSDISSPSLLISFAILGIFPLVAKKFIKLIRKDKKYG